MKHLALEVSRDEHYKTPYLQNLKESWPALARDYRHYCHSSHPKVGDMWVWTSPEGQKFFHLIMDQEDGDQHLHDSRLQSFKKSLKLTKKTIEEDKIKEIEFPKAAFQFTKDEYEKAKGVAAEVLTESGVQVLFS